MCALKKILIAVFLRLPVQKNSSTDGAAINVSMKRLFQVMMFLSKCLEVRIMLKAVRKIFQ